MATPLWLTKEEQKRFSALPETLRDGWQTKEETLTSYETNEALQMRAEITPLRRHPAVKELFEKVQKGEKVEQLTLPDLSEQDIAEFFFAVGARGLTLFLAAVLKEAKTDDDLRSLAYLSEMRHQILETNASISYA